MKLNPKEVRVIGIDGKQRGVFSLDEAKKIAEDEGQDLILVNRNQTPPVVRLGNYKVWLYEQKKKEREAKKKIKETKEIRIGFNEALHDLERKAKMIKEFLEEGHQVQIRLILKSRERLFTEIAEKKLSEFLNLIPLNYKIVNPLKKFSNFLLIVIAKQK
ncbi:MAG: translation initiation factor IF-3 [Candidatus Aenigmatarchaeota archaeon]